MQTANPVLTRLTQISHFSDRKSKNISDNQHISTYFLVYVSWFRNRSAPSSRVQVLLSFGGKFSVFECCLVVLILGGKTFSAAAVLDWDVGRYSKPLDEHKNKVWQLKYIENNHCCWSKAKHNTLLYFLLPRCYIVASKVAA